MWICFSFYLFTDSCLTSTLDSKWNVIRTCLNFGYLRQSQLGMWSKRHFPHATFFDVLSRHPWLGCNIFPWLCFMLYANALLELCTCLFDWIQWCELVANQDHIEFSWKCHFCIKYDVSNIFTTQCNDKWLHAELYIGTFYIIYFFNTIV